MSSDNKRELSREEKAALVTQINELRKASVQEVAAAELKVPGLEWLITGLMLHEVGCLSAESVVSTIKAQLDLPTPISPATIKLGELNHRLYTGRDLDTASDPEAGG